MSNLPPLLKDNKYECYIHDLVQQSQMIKPDRLKCSIPEYKDLPKITGPKGLKGLVNMLCTGIITRPQNRKSHFLNTFYILGDSW